MTIDDKQQFSYASEYLDTDQLDFYLSHHNQRKNRLKIRIRHYLDTDTRFLEIKEKNNRGTTSKTRHEINGYLEDDLIAEHVEGLEKLEESGFGKKLFSQFDRITLVNESLSERLTIDTNLSFRSIEDDKIAYKNLVVFELKQLKSDRYSTFYNALKTMKIRPKSFSKYCLGISNLYDIKQNRFLQQQREITKIENYA